MPVILPASCGLVLSNGREESLSNHQLLPGGRGGSQRCPVQRRTRSPVALGLVVGRCLRPHA
eukprot:6230084-Lingulodinium_polyedra.AAC.1